MSTYGGITLMDGPGVDAPVNRLGQVYQELAGSRPPANRRTDMALMLTRLAMWYARRAQRRRGRLFLDQMRPRPEETILDLGSFDGSHMAGLLPSHRKVIAADILPEPLATARTRYGYETLLLDESGRLPFPDQSIDIIFCSAVIEHATVDKERIRVFRSNRAFRKEALVRQRRMADEIRRVGRRYFVQTPHKYFIVESHTWLPLPIVLLPRPWQLRTIDFFNRWWPKKTSADFNLLTTRDMARLFPDAEIVAERSLGLTKSVIAVRR
ncbi:MAG: class I SAM-dependent methyltransferase [Dehalococcoidia bacterium]